MSGEVTDSLLNIMVYHQDYDTLYMKLQGMREGLSDLGVIALRRTAEQLKELTVTASPVVQGVDKFIVYPTAPEVDQSATSPACSTSCNTDSPDFASLKRSGKSPSTGRHPSIWINGRKVQYSRILGLNNDDILQNRVLRQPPAAFRRPPCHQFHHEATDRWRLRIRQRPLGCDYG